MIMSERRDKIVPRGFRYMVSDNQPKRVRVAHLLAKKAARRPITMLTAYDALTAPIFEAAGVDSLLVGDSIANVLLGYGSTIPVSLDVMVGATAAVSRSVKRPLIVADLPFGSYEASPEQAFDSATQLMKAGAHAVKLEGGAPRVPAVTLLVEAGIPVMGHLGYTPQSEHALSGPRLQGRGDQREQLWADALALQDAGAFAIVLEMVPAPLAKSVTRALEIPTIGIGAGPSCDGQVLVWSDMAGMTDWAPSFAKRFGEVGKALGTAATQYVEAVEAGTFPAPGNFRVE